MSKVSKHKSDKSNKFGKKHFRGNGPDKKNFKRKITKNQLNTKEIDKLTSSYSEHQNNSITLFEKMPLSSYMKKGLKDAGFIEPTEIQRESILFALQGKDILGAAKTGTGKTLAFLIPLLERLYVQKWSKLDGLGALVISPTRELAMQIFQEMNKVGKYHDFSAGLVIGGQGLKYETTRMSTCNIVICTPGRLLHHMDENPQFDAGSLQVLVLDEADRMLELGFENQMNAILSNLPQERQTLLFSATQTRSIKDLARLSLESPVFVSVHEHASKATPEELSELYCICNVEEKLNMLWSFIKNHKRKKILVFVQSCKQARYFSELFKKLRLPTAISSLYGTLHQGRRKEIYDDFSRKESGVLIATDIAARGLDFPAVDWVLQLDCPEDWKTYNHRVGRTARNNVAGNALLVLTPHESEPMLRHLRIHKFSLENIDINPKKIVSIQKKVEAALAGDLDLKEQGQRAFQSYLKSVFLMKDKVVFDVTQIDTDAFAASLGLVVAPRVRFLQKHLKSIGKPPKQSKPALLFGSVDSEDENDDDEDMIKVKRSIKELSEDEEADTELLPEVSRKQSKPTTKASVAKKLLRKSITANKKVVFDDKGEVVKDSFLQKLSKEGQEYEQDDQGTGGINIERAKSVLKAEDVFDKGREKVRVKELHKEKKRKEKELKNPRKRLNEDRDEGDSSDDDDGPDLSWLPDPDRVYGKEEANSDTEEEQIVSKTKKPKIQSESENDDLDTEQLQDDELLALKLLNG